MEKTISFITSNKSKYEEVRDFLRRHNSGINLEMVEMDLFEIQTRDQRAIAMHKAEDAWRKLGKPLMVEDSGIFIHKYGAFPGTLTKYVFKGIGYRGLFRLVDPGDGASFILTLVYIDENGRPHVFEGQQDGTLIKPEKLEINTDFPFDQVFVPEGSGGRTYEELKKKPNEYEVCSHRLEAVKRFLDWHRQNT